MSVHRAHLADLDELALQVREQTSRIYILEAISDYRSGSYRSAIVATWTAICFDIVSKFRELSAQGDAAAKTFISAVDKAIAQPKNPEMFLSIERQLLSEAEKIGFIGHREQIDLERIKEDRNYCAHPAFIENAALFQPSADQARAHIVHAVDHLLRHPPVEGKTALARFKAELLGTAFPPTDAAVEAWFKSRYIGLVKSTTLRALLIVAIKGSLGAVPGHIRSRALAVLRVASRLEHHLYSDAMKEQLPKSLSTLDDQALPRLASIMAQDQRVLTWLGDGLVARMQGALVGFPMDTAENRCLFALSNFQVFKDAVMRRFEQLDSANQAEVLAEHPARVFVPAAVAAFAAAASYRSAESLGRRIESLSSVLEPADLASILIAAGDNSEIWDASGIPDILARIFDGTVHMIKATGPFWVAFMLKMRENSHEDRFDQLSSRIAARGFVIPPAPPAVRDGN